MLYGAGCWPVKNSHIQKMKVAKIRMLRWIYRQIRLDKIRNEDIRERVELLPWTTRCVKRGLDDSGTCREEA